MKGEAEKKGINKQPLLEQSEIEVETPENKRV